MSHRRSRTPEACVRAYLAAMEARDLDEAQSYLDAGFVMYFPGAEPMHDLADLIAWAAPRYRFVRKAYEGFDCMQHASGAARVYCYGTLSGAWPDGQPFGGIRFIDRFEIENDLITRQDVWNDIAEMRGRHDRD